jgi:hypothetical protein
VLVAVSECTISAGEGAPNSFSRDLENRLGFSHKISLKDGIGMLGIHYQHGRFGRDRAGAVRAFLAGS